MKSTRLLVTALAAAWLLAGHGTAHAGCTISVSGVNFGGYDVFRTTPLDSTGTIVFECSKQDKRIRITLSRGSSSGYSPRTMRNGSEALDYNLFINAFGTVWGDGTQGTDFYYNQNPPNNRPVSLTVYGRIRELQDVAHGTYSDTVMAQIEF